MPGRRFGFTKAFPLITLLLVLIASPGAVYAHCDALNGPVVQAAEKALESGDFATVAIWVGEEQTGELKEKFEQTSTVYAEGGKARELAKDYFYEAAVRLHRQAEGMCYEGLKPAAPLPKDLAVAEKALAQKNPEAITSLLSESMGTKVDRMLAEVVAAEKSKEQSIEAGRKWTDAYVRYITFIHGLYSAIETGPAHGLESHQD